jgi:hypothetical protein
MFAGAAFIGTVLAPSYALPIAIMAAIVLAGGAVMDRMSENKHLALRLLGPALALAGLVGVTWLLVAGGI